MFSINMFDTNDQRLSHRYSRLGINNNANYEIKYKFHDAISFAEDSIKSFQESNCSTNCCFDMFLPNMKKTIPSQFMEQFMDEHKRIIKEIEILTNKNPDSPSARLADTSALIDFLKLIQLFKVPGIKKIEVKYDLTENHYLFNEISFPEALIPERYFCDIDMQVMVSPCKLPGGNIERATILKMRKAGNTQNPFNREELLDFRVDQELSAEIRLLLKKAQLVYYFFNGQKDYAVFKQKLIDKDISYAMFRESILADGHLQHDPRLFFSSAGTQHTLIPPKSILDIFVKYNMNIVKPSKHDFNTLIDKVFNASDKEASSQLLTHPYTETFRIDISKIERLLNEDEDVRCTTATPMF